MASSLESDFPCIKSGSFTQTCGKEMSNKLVTMQQVRIIIQLLLKSYSGFSKNNKGLIEILAKRISIGFNGLKSVAFSFSDLVQKIGRQALIKAIEEDRPFDKARIKLKRLYPTIYT